MQLRKYRWSRHYESAEAELIQLLEDRKIKAERRIAEEFEELPAQKQPHDTQLWCAEGSIVFRAEGKSLSLQAGDALDIPANTEYEATAGFTGAVWYEQQLDT